MEVSVHVFFLILSILDTSEKQHKMTVKFEFIDVSEKLCNKYMKTSNVIFYCTLFKLKIIFPNLFFLQSEFWLTFDNIGTLTLL